MIRLQPLVLPSAMPAMSAARSGRQRRRQRRNIGWIANRVSSPPASKRHACRDTREVVIGSWGGRLEGKGSRCTAGFANCGRRSYRCSRCAGPNQLFVKIIGGCSSTEFPAMLGSNRKVHRQRTASRSTTLPVAGRLAGRTARQFRRLVPQALSRRLSMPSRPSPATVELRAVKLPQRPSDPQSESPRQRRKHTILQCQYADIGRRSQHTRRRQSSIPAKGEARIANDVVVVNA